MLHSPALCQHPSQDFAFPCRHNIRLEPAACVVNLQTGKLASTNNLESWSAISNSSWSPHGYQE